MDARDTAILEGLSGRSLGGHWVLLAGLLLFQTTFVWAKDGTTRAGRDLSASDPIPVPQWARGARVLGVRYEDISRLEELRKAYHASVLILYHVPEVSNGWCPQGTWEEVEKFVKAAHDHGFKVMGYLDGTYAEEKFHTGEHKDWVQRNRKGEPEHYQPEHIRQHRYCYCFNGPWHDRWVRIAEREAKIGMDGMFVDNPDYMAKCGESCFCSHCQRRFRQEKGGDLFTAPDEVRRNWLSQCLGWHVRDVYNALKRTRPDKEFAITSNTCGPSRHRSMGVLGPNENVLFREASGRHPDCRAMVERDQFDGGRKPLWFILTTGKKWTPETGRLYECLLASVVSAGGCPMVWAHNYSDDPNRPGFSTTDTIFAHAEVGRAVAECFGFMEQHLERVTAETFFRPSFKGVPKGVSVTVSRTEGDEVVIHVVSVAPGDVADLDLRIRLPWWVAPAKLARFSPHPTEDPTFIWTPDATGWSRLQVKKMRVWDMYVSDGGER
ncbi:MAG: hypothetical protein JXQ73_11805 [Phycisphaerae bacterium]|nr:hypothetical protein [Phycisphaerae bacterium]